MRNLDFNKDDAALIIVDMQNAFISKKGSLAKIGVPISRTSTVIGPIKVLKAKCVSAGIPVIYIQHTHRADGMDMGLIDLVHPGTFANGHCFENTWDAEIIDELKPEKGDIVVKKYRFSGFFNTELNTILKALKKETLIVTGIATNVCVESTVRDAFYLDYNCFVPVECTASFAKEAEIGTIENFKFAFARVLCLEEMMGRIV